MNVGTGDGMVLLVGAIVGSRNFRLEIKYSNISEN